MIKQLTKLANHLDSKGLIKEADYLDAVIRKNAAQPTLITAEEIRTICKRNRTYAVELKEAKDKLYEAQKLVDALQGIPASTSDQNWCPDWLGYAEREEEKRQDEMRLRQDRDQMREQMGMDY
jgi:hypothetical protein